MKLQKKASYLLFIALLIITASRSHAESPKEAASEELISKITVVDFHKLGKDLQVIITHAAADFAAAIAGSAPKFAKVESEVMDGGTMIYKGDGYKLTVYKKMASLGGIPGYYYGPVLHFTNSSVSSEADISSVRFISREEFNKLPKH